MTAWRDELSTFAQDKHNSSPAWRLHADGFILRLFCVLGGVEIDWFEYIIFARIYIYMLSRYENIHEVRQPGRGRLEGIRMR